MSDKLIKLNDQFLLIELDGTPSRSGLLDISLLRRVWKAGELTHLGTVPDRNSSFSFAPVGDVTDLYFEGDETSIRVNIPFRDVAAIIAGPPTGMRCQQNTTPGQQTLSELPAKIIQIQSASNPGDGNCGPHTQLFALCEDGTVWCQYHSSGRSNVPNDGLWHRVST